jgi:hypothetical protein
MVIAGVHCSKSDLLKSSGPIRSEKRQMNEIREVILYDKVNLILTQDSVQELRVEAGENLLEDISTSLEGNTLTIRDNNKYKWMRNVDLPVNVYLSGAALNKIIYYGAGNISSTNELKKQSFVIDCVAGVGSLKMKLKTEHIDVFIRELNTDITLEGSAGASFIYCADQGAIDLRNFESGYILMDHRSVRDMYLFASGTLAGNILYKGNVYYKGDPAVIKVETKNSGKLYKLN